MEMGRRPLDKIKCKRHEYHRMDYYLTVKWSKENTEIMGTGKNPQNGKHKWANSLDMDTTAVCARRVCQTNAPFGISFWPWCLGYLLLLNFWSFMPFPIACVCLLSVAHSLYVEKFSVYHDTNLIDCCCLCLDFKELTTFLCALCRRMVVCFTLCNCYSLFQV
jgi:hypothetical protein